MKHTRFLEILQIWFISLSAYILHQLPPSLEGLSSLLALLLHIAATYFLNDYCDWTEDLQNPRRKNSGQKPRGLLWLAVLLFIGSMTFAWFSRIHVFVILTFLNMLGIAYSVKPVRLKSRMPFPLLIHFVCGGLYFVTPLLANHILIQAHHLLLTAFWAIILASASFANEVIDQEADRAAGIKTLGQLIQKTTALKALCVLHVTAAFIFAAALHTLGLRVAGGTTLVLIVLYLAFCVRTSHDHNLLGFRKLYRVTFALITLIPCFEILFF